MKFLLPLVVLIFPLLISGQNLLTAKEQIIFNKNFFCSAKLLNYEAKCKTKIFNSVSKEKVSAIENAVNNNFEDGLKNILLFQISDREMQTIGNALHERFQSDKDFRQFVADSIVIFNKYTKKETPLATLLTAWETDVKGVNHIIDVYGLGKPPNYPAIDSISFNVHDKNYPFLLGQVIEVVEDELKNYNKDFMPGFLMAIRLLELNSRFEAADYEPMESGQNRLAKSFIKKIEWNKYPYSFILVPGAGTDNYSDTINPVGIIRCRIAKIFFAQGLAPFIIVSGARVHPYKTKYTEATVMKNYLINELGLPEKNIIIEPHARHTTTNMRNANRLAMNYGIPLHKKALVATDRGQSSYITNKNFDNRCFKELGYLPYTIGKRISPLLFEYTPTENSSIINSLEPLDP